MSDSEWGDQQLDDTDFDLSDFDVGPRQGRSALDPVVDDAIELHEDLRSNPALEVVRNPSYGLLLVNTVVAIQRRLAERGHEGADVSPVDASVCESAVEERAVRGEYCATTVLDTGALEGHDLSIAAAVYVRVVDRDGAPVTGLFTPGDPDGIPLPNTESEVEADLWSDAVDDTDPLAALIGTGLLEDPPEEVEEVDPEQIHHEPLLDLDDVDTLVAAFFDSTPVEDPVPMEDPVESAAHDSDWDVEIPIAPESLQYVNEPGEPGHLEEEFLDIFLDECTGEVEKLESACTSWEAEPASAEPLATFFRVLHNMKGIARGVGLNNYASLVHNFETLLAERPGPGSGVPDAYFAELNRWVDCAVAGLEHVGNERADIRHVMPPMQHNPAPVATAAEPAATVPVEPAADQAPTPPPPVPVHASAARHAKPPISKDEGTPQTFRLSAEQIDKLLNVSSQVQQFGSRTAQSIAAAKGTTTDLAQRMKDLRSYISRVADEAMANMEYSKAPGGNATSDLDALEMDRYTALQEAASILRESVEDIDDLINDADAAVSNAEQLMAQHSMAANVMTTSLRSARMIPISRLMPGLRRLARSTANELGKQVRVVVDNESGALDRDHFNRCRTVLEHMVRNALDHGIESTERRAEAGKTASGTIRVSAAKQGNNYIIELADDGAGIDPDTMRAKGLERGILTEGQQVTDEEAQRLIFHKGFSTAAQLTQISGRGVGMDIVLDEVQKMGGDIAIRSSVGQGTAFTFEIPSTVSFNGAIQVSAGDYSYAIPLDGLLGVERIPVDDFYQAVNTGGTVTALGMACEPTDPAHQR